MVDPNRALFEAVLDLLRPLLEELVFVGGCATGLLVSDPAAGGIRPTKDVDAIVDVTSYTKYAALSEQLRTLGLTEDSTVGAPLCRWRYQQLTIDVMPIDEEILGFSNRWYPQAIAFAERRSIGGTDFRLVTAVYFVATKLEAFHGRGTNDLSMSQDLEDVITLVDGRSELIAEIAAAEPSVREYFASELQTLLDRQDFVDALPGFLLPDAGSQARRSQVVARLREIARL
jgi:hypothetical protein